MAKKLFNFSDLFNISRYGASTWSLLLSNLAVIALAIKGHWSFGEMIWIYWFQSVIIGFFAVIKMVCAGIYQIFWQKEDIELPAIVKIFAVPFVLFTPLFFIVHYGAFHLGYALFISALFASLDLTSLARIFPFLTGIDVSPYVPAVSLKPIFYASLIFMLNHLLSFVYNFRSDIKKSVDYYFTGPYSRVFLMHFTIIIGAMLGKWVMLFFLFLKTIVDVNGHMREHDEEHLKLSGKE